MENKRELPEEVRELYRYQARNRAGQNIYHLAHENELSKMWTITYGDEAVTDRKQALDDFKQFMKRLNYHLKRKINYVAVAEIQKQREKETGKAVIHFHIAMENFYIEKDEFQSIWGHGNVRYSTYKDGRKIENNKTAVAIYMSKYLKKDMEDNPELAGQKMYLSSKGLKRPPRGNGIINENEINNLKNTGYGHEIKGRPDLEYYKLPLYKFPTFQSIEL